MAGRSLPTACFNFNLLEGLLRGTGIAAYSLTRISLLELVLSGKLLYLTTFSSRAAKMKKMNRPKFAMAKPMENKKKKKKEM